MRLPIEQQSKTARIEYVVINVREGSFRGLVAMPTHWLKGKPSDYDEYKEGLSATEAKGWPSLDLFLAMGSLKSSLKNMDDLHGTVNDVYTLVDEGYVDGRTAISAFS